MTKLTLQIDVAAPPQRCFDLARSMDFHTWSMRASGERIVGGRGTGLIALGEEVEFEARHIGVTRQLRALVTEFDRPNGFVDEQVRGPFRSLTHGHTFEPLSGHTTRVTDTLEFDVGYGPLGLAVERLVIRPHLQHLIAQHQLNIKQAAESDAWRQYLPDLLL